MRRRNAFRTLAALASATVALSAAVAAPAYADAVPSPIVKKFCSIAGIEWTGGIEGDWTLYYDTWPRGTVQFCADVYQALDYDNSADYYTIDVYSKWQFTGGLDYWPAYMAHGVTSSVASPIIPPAEVPFYGASGSRKSNVSCTSPIPVNVTIAGGLIKVGTSLQMCDGTWLHHDGTWSSGASWHSDTAGGLREAHTLFSQQVPQGVIPTYTFDYWIPRYRNVFTGLAYETLSHGLEQFQYQVRKDGPGSGGCICSPTGGDTGGGGGSGYPPVPAPSRATDFTGDSKADVIWRKSGDMGLYRMDGRGNGYFNTGVPVQIGTGWGDADLLTATGDFSGDGSPGVIWRKPDSNLYMLEGNGSGGWKTGVLRQIGTGWGDAELLMSPGDFSGDGKPDLIWRKSGDQNLYRMDGNGSGGFKTGAPVQIGTGWGDAELLMSPGDFSGDGKPDLIWRKSGDQNLYRMDGNGSGGFKTGAPVQIGTGWGDASLLIGVG